VAANTKMARPGTNKLGFAPMRIFTSDPTQDGRDDTISPSPISCQFRTHEACQDAPVRRYVHSALFFAGSVGIAVCRKTAWRTSPELIAPMWVGLSVRSGTPPGKSLSGCWQLWTWGGRISARSWSRRRTHLVTRIRSVYTAGVNRLRRSTAEGAGYRLSLQLPGPEARGGPVVITPPYESHPSVWAGSRATCRPSPAATGAC
jgi:hypothetical protein